MGCRIGMATNVMARVRQLKDEGIIPTWARCTILSYGMNYHQANAHENAARFNRGPNCEGQAGGGYVPGNVWSVYRIDW